MTERMALADLARQTMVEDEAAREDKWAYFEQNCTEFAASEPDGWAAVLRAVSRAMSAQRESLKK